MTPESEAVTPPEPVSADAETPHQSGDGSAQRMGMRWEEDAERWGNALNEAAWKYIEAFTEETGERVSAKHWNQGKTILRTAILSYAAAVVKAHTVVFRDGEPKTL